MEWRYLRTAITLIQKREWFFFKGESKQSSRKENWQFKYLLGCVSPSTPEFVFPQSPGFLFGIHMIFIHSILQRNRESITYLIMISNCKPYITLFLYHILLVVPSYEKI